MFKIRAITIGPVSREYTRCLRFPLGLSVGRFPKALRPALQAQRHRICQDLC